MKFINILFKSFKTIIKPKNNQKMELKETNVTAPIQTDDKSNQITNEVLKNGAFVVKNNLKLNFNLDSLKLIEDQIKLQKRTSNYETKSNIILNIGSFYGQLLIQTYGGFWETDEQIDKCSVLICNKFIKVNPFDIVKKHLKFGKRSSIVHHYIATGILSKIQ